MKGGAWPDTLKKQPHLPVQLKPYWDAFIELHESAGVTGRTVHEWCSLRGIDDSSDYVYLLTGLEAERNRTR